MADLGAGNTTISGFSTAASVTKAGILNNMIILASVSSSTNKVLLVAQSHYSKSFCIQQLIASSFSNQVGDQFQSQGDCVGHLVRGNLSPNNPTWTDCNRSQTLAKVCK